MSADERVPRESEIVKHVLTFINSHIDCYGYKVHGDSFTVNQPDIVGSWRGRALAVEVKKTGENARFGQSVILNRWGRTGALIGVVHSLEEFKILVGDNGKDIRRELRGNQVHEQQATQRPWPDAGANHHRSGGQRRPAAHGREPERPVARNLHTPTGAPRRSGARDERWQLTCQHGDSHYYIAHDGSTGCLLCERDNTRDLGDGFTMTQGFHPCSYCQLTFVDGTVIDYSDGGKEFLCWNCHHLTEIEHS